jgi:hypothetical protein
MKRLRGKENEKKWRIHLDRKEDYDQACYSISNVKGPGWNTDSGHAGYGLPIDLAKWICDQLNKAEDCGWKADEWGHWVKNDC